jgi:hypothetical protein
MVVCFVSFCAHFTVTANNGTVTGPKCIQWPSISVSERTDIDLLVRTCTIQASFVYHCRFECIEE